MGQVSSGFPESSCQCSRAGSARRQMAASRSAPPSIPGLSLGGQRPGCVAIQQMPLDMPIVRKLRISLADGVAPTIGCEGVAAS